MEDFTKQTLRKLVDYEDIDTLINNHMGQPDIQKNPSMKVIHAKQKIWRIRNMALNYRDNSKKRVYKRTIEPLTAQRRYDSDDSDSDEKQWPIEFDDGKRDKIFSKTFLRSISNQSKVQVALIQMMGEDRLLRSELQAKVNKPSKFSALRESPSKLSADTKSSKGANLSKDLFLQFMEDETGKSAAPAATPMNILAQKLGMGLLGGKIENKEPQKPEQPAMRIQDELTPIKQINNFLGGAFQNKILQKKGQSLFEKSRNSTGSMLPPKGRPSTSIAATKPPKGIQFHHSLSQLNLAHQESSISQLIGAPAKKDAATPSYLRPTTCFANQSRQKKKVVIQENVFKEPSLALLNNLAEDGKPMTTHVPNFYDIKSYQPKVPPPNYQEIMKKQAQVDCHKPPLPFLSKSLNSLHTFYLNPDDEALKEKAAYLMQKSRYHEFEPHSRKAGKQVFKKLVVLNEKLSKRHQQTNLDIQELHTEFTKAITQAWDKKVPMKVPPYQKV